MAAPWMRFRQRRRSSWGEKNRAKGRRLDLDRGAMFCCRSRIEEGFYHQLIIAGEPQIRSIPGEEGGVGGRLLGGNLAPDTICQDPDGSWRSGIIKKRILTGIGS